MDVIPDFDGRGLLPNGDMGFYYPSLEEFITRFVSVINIETRTNLFEKYIAFCIKCLNTNALISHYVNGSYTTNEEEPGDIDLLVMLDGSTVDEGPDELYEEYMEINDRETIKEKYSCHTWCVLDYNPNDFEVLFKYHNSVKNDVITWWQTNFLDEERTILDPVNKGVIILPEEEIKKMRSY